MPCRRSGINLFAQAPLKFRNQCHAGIEPLDLEDVGKTAFHNSQAGPRSAGLAGKLKLALCNQPRGVS